MRWMGDATKYDAHLRDERTCAVGNVVGMKGQRVLDVSSLKEQTLGGRGSIEPDLDSP